MSFLSSSKFITGGLRVLGTVLAFLSILCMGMWLYSVLYVNAADQSYQLVAFVGAGAIGFFLLALAKLIEIGDKLVEKK